MGYVVCAMARGYVARKESDTWVMWRGRWHVSSPLTLPFYCLTCQVISYT